MATSSASSNELSPLKGPIKLRFRVKRPIKLRIRARKKQQQIAATTFPKFRRLPTEIRFMIWELSLLHFDTVKRVLTVATTPAHSTSTTDNDPVVLDSEKFMPYYRYVYGVPALLHVNFESRFVALPQYVKCFPFAIRAADEEQAMKDGLDIMYINKVIFEELSNGYLEEWSKARDGRSALILRFKKNMIECSMYMSVCNEVLTLRDWSR